MLYVYAESTRGWKEKPGNSSMKTLSKNWKNVLVLVLNFCYNLHSGKNILKTPYFYLYYRKIY